MKRSSWCRRTARFPESPAPVSGIRYPASGLRYPVSGILSPVPRLLCAAVCLLAAGCCGYSVRSLLPPHLRTVAVPAVKNTTLQPGLEDRLTELLTTAFNRDRSLRVAALEQANLLVNVTITGYSRAASVYDESQNISSYELSASAQVEAEDRVRDEAFFSGSVSERLSYDPVPVTEDSAAGLLLAKLSDEIVRRIITAW